jgi:transposase-like protein
MGARSNVNVSERREAVLALLRREEPAKVLARRYGVSEKTLYSWRDDFVHAGHAALTFGREKDNAQGRQIAELQNQLSERDKGIGELTIDNRILKKSLDGSY